MINSHPTWQIMDSSKLDTALDCRRQFFFQHILGWRVDKPNHDLYFGNAWHIAREYQLIHGYDDIKGAFLAFMDFYRKEFSQESDEIYRPKDPEAVGLALVKFANERQDDLRDNELLYTEISGTVPITEDGKVLHYRMDSVLRRKENDKIFSWDHKSATEKSMNYRGWEEKFYLSIQNGTYTHCLYCMYPVEDVIGVEFDGTAFAYLKRGSKQRDQGYHISFKQVPAWKTPDQMNVWLWNVVDLVEDLERELDRLSYCEEGDAVMQCFPMNTNNCTKYYGCAFHDYCMSWPNPLQRCYEPPLGFKVEHWDPREMKTTNKKDLKWGGEG